MQKVVFTRVETDKIITYLRGLKDENNHIPHTTDQLCSAITGFVGKKISDQVLHRLLREFELTCIRKQVPRGTGLWAKVRVLETRLENLQTWAKAAGYVEPVDPA
jgi:hypothetical protein